MPFPSISVRSMSNKYIVMPKPAIHNGKPMIPLAWCSGTITVVAEHEDLPDVQEPSDADEGIFQTKHRWVMNNMTGTETAGSGQTNYGDDFWLEDWEEVGGGLSWKSVHPYRPRYYPKNEFLTDNKRRTYSRVLNFNHRHVEHMWLDLGHDVESMTVMVAGVFERFGKRGQHFLLDSGRETPIFLDGKAHWIDDNTNERALMHYGRKRSRTSATNRVPILKGKILKAKHHSAHRPKVMFTVFNGNKSLHGTIDPKFKSIKKGKLADKNFRYLVLGRGKNRVRKGSASDMTLFEIRIWEGPLTTKQIKRQAKRMASRWRFNKYWN